MSDFEKWWEEEGQERASLDGCAYHVAKIAWMNGAYKTGVDRDGLIELNMRNERLWRLENAKLMTRLVALRRGADKLC